MILLSVMTSSNILTSFLLFLISSVEGCRILVVLPTPTRSHYAGGGRLVQKLVERGHELVVISPYKENTMNYTWVPIEVTSLVEAVPELAEELVENQSFINGQHIIWKNFNTYARHITNLPKLKHFVQNDTSNFDLIISEEFVQSVFYMFSFKYKAPLILLTTFGSGHYISNFMGNSLELASVPHEFIDYFGPLNFFERIRNAACTLYDLIFRNFYSTYVQNSLAKEVFGHLGEMPSLWELERNVSLVLVNSHFSLTGVRPTLPNIVEVGGIHIKEPKALNEVFQTLLDAAVEGAIVFSFGSVTDLSVQPPELISATLRALTRLKRTVLLKWSSEKLLPINSTNLYVVPWLPQNDILAHPNVALFITHGGLLSVQEAIHHAVPTVCIPFFGDQTLNCRRSEVMGHGIHIPPQDLTADILYHAIQRVLTEASYKQNVAELSSRFKDRLSTALDTAVYWIEYCARHKGMNFAKSPKRNLYWYQHCYVDVLVVLLLVYQAVLSWRKLLRFWTQKMKLD